MESVEEIAARTQFSGVVRVDRGGEVVLARAYGLAHRGYGVANTLDTRFGIASGTKPLTALVTASLVEEGRLELGTTARSVLGGDLPLIGGDVTVEHLLSHRSGIGDYVDEASGDVGDYVLRVPVHELATTEGYVGALDGYPPKFPAGERFAYCNSGFVVLALIAERVGGRPFHDLVRQRVTGPAGMERTEFVRSDEPDGRTAVGYLDAVGSRTNVLHLPVRGSGDGGIASTVADIHRFWDALHAGRIVPPSRVADMLRARSDVPARRLRYGLGFWLHASGPAAMLEGMDAGVSFRSVHDPVAGVTHTVVSNTSEGAWPLARYLNAALTP